MDLSPSVSPARFVPLSAEQRQSIDRLVVELRTEIGRLSRELIIPGRASARSHFKDDTWGGQEVVTSTDLAVSQALLNLVKHDFPYSETEEQLSSNIPQSDRFWQIDPIDGTKLYDPSFPDYGESSYSIDVDGHTHSVVRHPSQHCWGVMVSLLERTTDGGYLSRVGILHRPMLDETWVVGLDRVVRRYLGDSETIVTPPTTGQQRRVAGIETVYSSLQVQLDYLKRAKLFSPDLSLVSLGSSSSFYANFLTGDINCFALSDLGVKSWDFAAGYALLTALGARITKFDGSPLRTICDSGRKITGGVRVWAPWVSPRSIQSLG